MKPTKLHFTAIVKDPRAETKIPVELDIEEVRSVTATGWSSTVLLETISGKIWVVQLPISFQH